VDIHSYSRPDRVRVRHIDLDLDVDFERKRLLGSATLHFDAGSSRELSLDTRDLEISRVEHERGEAAFHLGERDPILGAPLSIELPPGARWVRVHYRTSLSASGLQWCEPAQTAGKTQPFLYTQSQAIHARSWIPLQDTPGVRVTFSARVRTPPGLTAVMGAEMEESGGEHRFHMPQPVPSYLISLAAGGLAFRALGPRSGVYAEPALLDAAAFEFAETEAMMQAVEEMYGPYRWGRYDLLVLPPSFPFGGMENPRLTFATPTILAGDRSLVSLVAHELAHSWSGNLVTNATWSDFWLNEGFTVYLERRILEKLYGRDRACMEATLARADLAREMAEMASRDHVLEIDLAGRDPDDGCTLVPYEKGALFLTALEQVVGRKRFDTFLRSWFDTFAFRSVATSDFVQYLGRQLPDAAAAVPVKEWLSAPGIPAGAPEPHSDALARVEAAVERWMAGDLIDTSSWSTQERLHFLRTASAPLGRIDREFAFTQTGNAEVLHQWLLMAIREGYEPALARLADFLTSVGRRKYIKTLYAELAKTPEGRARAAAIYEKARPGYHPIAQSTVDQVLMG